VEVLTATLVIAAITGLLLFFLGMKYPLGGRDWPFDRPTTIRYVISGTLFFVILGLVYWVTRYWDYPLSGKGLAYVAFIGMAILFILGIIFPKGKET
jgi:hypothetical protein